MIKIRQTKIIQFDLPNRKVIINVTKKKQIVYDEETVICHKYGTGYEGYFLLLRDNQGLNYLLRLSKLVAKSISRYFEQTGNNLKYDFYEIPFDKLYSA